MIEDNINNKNNLLQVKLDPVFKALFNENDMNTLEWVVMQILNVKYEDIHGKVKVKNTNLINTYFNERRKSVDLLVDYDGCDILIELNNNYTGNYLRNLMYAFNIVLNHYNKGTSAQEIINKRVKVILVNLNWYAKDKDYHKIPKKKEHIIPYPEDNINDFIIKAININLDLYKDLCYDKVSEWEKLWKLLTISNEEELKLFVDNEKLLKRYQKQLFYLSHNKDFKEKIMNEIIEENALFDQTYGVGYRDGIKKGLEQGIEQKQNAIVLEMLKDNVSLELISKYVNLEIDEIQKIIDNNK